MMDHTQVQEQLPAFVLGALERHETAAVSEHIEWCAGCRHNAEQLAVVAAKLAEAIPEAQPPDSLQVRIEESVGRSPGSS